MTTHDIFIWQDGHPIKTFAELREQLYPGSIVRIRQHLYIDGKPLTEEAPEWSSYFE